MSFEIGYGFQNVPKVYSIWSELVSFFLCKQSFTKTVLLKSKIVSHYKWVIWYKIELILYFEQSQFYTALLRL